ncbi:hypothetical protein BDQ17DRAFT_1410694 [Cyathus striatus]|nr:hypothetical protein BDQ17DRAFT_1410694 [Cyathus striatus]
MESSVLKTLLEHTQIFRFRMTIAIIVHERIVLLYYDYFLTLNLEVNLIWPSSLGVVKILFLIARYSPFIDSFIIFYHHFTPNLSPESCLKAYHANGWTYLCGAFFAEAILTLRTWAVWKNNNKAVTFGLPVFFISIWIASGVIMSKFLRTMQCFRGCLVIRGSSILSVIWILLMVFNFGAFILMALWVFKRRARRAFTTASYPGYKSGRSELLRIVYRDGKFFNRIPSAW